MTRSNCAACRRTIDASAKLCPYCGADPATGERVDTQAMLQEVFRPREISTSQSVIQYARQRQGIVIAVSVFVAFLVLTAFHQYVTMRNSTAVTDSPAVPLSEITDLTNKAEETTPVPIPHLDFQYDGQPQAMRTYIIEAGAVKPAAAQPAPGSVATPAPAPTRAPR